MKEVTAITPKQAVEPNGPPVQKAINFAISDKTDES
jgi:hypothetical protein